MDKRGDTLARGVRGPALTGWQIWDCRSGMINSPWQLLFKIKHLANNSSTTRSSTQDTDFTFSLGMAVLKPITATCISWKEKIKKIHSCPSTTYKALRLLSLISNNRGWRTRPICLPILEVTLTSNRNENNKEQMPGNSGVLGTRRCVIWLINHFTEMTLIKNKH